MDAELLIKAALIGTIIICLLAISFQFVRFLMELTRILKEFRSITSHAAEVTDNIAQDYYSFRSFFSSGKVGIVKNLAGLGVFSALIELLKAYIKSKPEELKK